MTWILLWLLIGYATTAVLMYYKGFKEEGRITVNDVGISMVAGLLGPLLTIAVGVLFASEFFETHGRKTVWERPDENEGG